MLVDGLLRRCSVSSAGVMPPFDALAGLWARSLATCPSWLQPRARQGEDGAQTATSRIFSASNVSSSWPGDSVDRGPRCGGSRAARRSSVSHVVLTRVGYFTCRWACWSRRSAVTWRSDWFVELAGVGARPRGHVITAAVILAVHGRVPINGREHALIAHTVLPPRDRVFCALRRSRAMQTCVTSVRLGHAGGCDPSEARQAALVMASLSVRHSSGPGADARTPFGQGAPRWPGCVGPCS